MGKKIIAFDIGGTNMRAAVVGGEKIFNYTQVRTPKSRSLFLKKIGEFIEKFDFREVKGIGIGIAGPVENGVIKNAPHLPLKNFDLKKYLEKKFKKRAEIKNDTGCFALAELKRGVKSKNFILITLGTGIGVAIVVNGKEYKGEGYGTEIGHMHIHGVEWESLWRKTRREIKKEFNGPKLIKDLVKMDNKKSKKILNEAADYLGEGIASLVSAFNPEVVLIGGGVREAGSSFLKLIKEKTQKHSFLKKRIPILFTTLKHQGIIGASLLIK